MIDFYSAPTPNGYKVVISLEEMGLPYQLHTLELAEQEQKKTYFLKINPNGRIPAIVNRDADNFAVFESGAILLCLADKTGQFLPQDAQARSVVIQWLMFQMAGVGPMMGQTSVFANYFPEKLPSVIERYRKESLRLMQVLNDHLADHEYLADTYSIADMATFPWASLHHVIDVDISAMNHLRRWIDAIAVRPAAVRGLEVPASYTDEERIQRAKRIITV